tara:strand:+ start:2429 stop:5041 length:2613 start_codon:yes stop_codon:yes gene_type:complete
MSVTIEIIDYKYSSTTKTEANYLPTSSVVGELDVTDHSDFPLAMTFQITDFKDLTSTTGDYSKTFKIPATKNNNKLLKNSFTPNILNGDDFNSTALKDCRIIFDGFTVLVGTIKINDVGGFDETPSYYSCTFFGNNLGWSNKITDKYMNEIEWGASGTGLIYQKPNIIATWQHEDSDNLSNSPIVYPITSYGKMNDGGIDRTIQLLDQASGSSASYLGFFNNGSPYGISEPVADWRPAVFVKTTLDNIFKKAGYTISSSFMNTDMFKKLVWLLPNFQYNNPDDLFILHSYGNGFSGEALIQASSITIPFGGVDTGFPIALNLNNASNFVLNTSTDNVGWNATNGNFEVQEYGYYDIKLDNFGFFWSTAGLGAGTQGAFEVSTIRIQLQVETVGRSGFNTVGFCDAPPISSTSNVNGQDGTGVYEGFGSEGITRYFNKGDKIRIILKFVAKNTSYDTNKVINFYIFGSSSPTSSSQSTIANGLYSIALKSQYVEYGQTYNLTDVINKDYKQIDFIKGIAHSFNLQMSTDEVNKIVSIEPFDDFYQPLSTAIDWTHKLDRSMEITNKWIENDLKRNLVFKYKTDDKDAKVKFMGENFFFNIEDIYPYREDLSNSFKKGDSTFENPFFAGTYTAKDQDATGSTNTDPPPSGCLWTENVSANDEGRPDKGYEFLPRLLYWNKYSPAVGSASKFAKVQTFTTTTQFIVAGTVTGTYLSTIYPQATMYNQNSNLSPNLAYGNIWVTNFDDSNSSYDAAEIVKGLYETYYLNMFLMIKKNPILRTVNIHLNSIDIMSLDFRKLIYIDGCYWRLNKVIDYSPNQNKTTKVELVEWTDFGASTASQPSFLSSRFQNTGNWAVDSSNNNTPLFGNPSFVV